MSSCGSGKSSKRGGSKAKGKSCKGDALHKKVHMKTSKEHLTVLRTALRDELGGDRNVLAGFGAFTKYDREGLALDVHFRTGSDITDQELEWAYELVSSNLSPLGHRFNPQDKMDDLCDPSSRYALVTERPTAAPAAATASKKGKGKKSSSSSSSSSVGRPVAFAHFRFTVEGETQEAMTGVPVLMVRDLHVAPEVQRKGVGKHLCQLLELAAKKHAMQGVMVLAPEGDAGDGARAFMSTKLRGYQCVDDQWAPTDDNLSAFAKSLLVKPTSSVGAATAAAVSPASPQATAAAAAAAGAAAKGRPAPASSPDSILCGFGVDEDSGSATPSPEPARAAATAATATPAAAPSDKAAAAPAAVQGGAESTEAVARLEAAFDKTTLSPNTPAPPGLFCAAVSPTAAAAAAPAAGGATAPSMSFADFGMAAAEEDVSDDDEEDEEDEEDGDSEWEEVDGEEEEASGDEEDEETDAAAAAGDEQADDILGQLVDLFKAENGRDPSEEEMAQWVQTLKEAAAEGGLNL